MRAYLLVLILASCSSKKESAPAPAPEPAPKEPNATPSTPGATATPPASSTQPPAPAGKASPAIAAANALASAVALTCKQAARDVKGSEGTAYYMKCPDCAEIGSVWGTDRYTDDSNVCSAALHAGAIPRKGGAILVTWIPGLPTYIGSARNGVTSSSYGHWGRSFYVQAVDDKGATTTPPPPPIPEGKILFDCHMGIDIVQGDMLHILCPAGCTSGRLWGTNVYTGDSAVCVAAVHAGVVTADKGGEVTVKRGGAQETFAGSAQNGVTSDGYAHFDSSFTFAPGATK